LLVRPLLNRQLAFLALPLDFSTLYALFNQYLITSLLFIVATGEFYNALQNQALALQFKELEKRVEKQESAGTIDPQYESPVETSPSEGKGLRKNKDDYIGAFSGETIAKPFAPTGTSNGMRQLQQGTKAANPGITDIPAVTAGRPLKELDAQLTTLQALVIASFASVNKRVDGVENKLVCVSPNSNDKAFILSGCNLHVENGMTSRSTLVGANSLGNVVIGYNEGGARSITGSHNLVLGVGNSYTKSGGIVSGRSNTLNADLAVLLGGENNVASGLDSVLAGGKRNVASGLDSVVDGGRDNKSTNTDATISGGAVNTASGVESSVFGGDRNTAAAYESTLSGGDRNAASGFRSSLFGGGQNTASGKYSSLFGGKGNTANNNHATVSGGSGNTANAAYSSVFGGNFNTARGYYSTISGGYKNTASGPFSSVFGGDTRTADGTYSVTSAEIP
jgi:hypothetical protein